MQGWSAFASTQPLASKIMVNSILKNRLSHAYLINGERGTGKKTLAKLLAMTLFCENRAEDVNPCFSCHQCVRIESGNHPDVHWVEPDGTSIKNEQIDYLRKEFSYSGVESTKKVYIVNETETLTTHAANRLLKFLEEPSISSTALLLTEQSQAIIPTIRSRCQRIDLEPLDEVAFQEKLLQLNLENLNRQKVALLSALTTNIDEALSLHEQGKVYEIKQLIEKLFVMLNRHYSERFLFVHEDWLPVLTERKDQQLGLDLLLMACRDLIRFQINRNKPLSFFGEDEPILTETVERFSNKRLVNMLKLILEAKQKWAQHVHPTLVIEQLILQF